MTSRGELPKYSKPYSKVEFTWDCAGQGFKLPQHCIHTRVDLPRRNRDLALHLVVPCTSAADRKSPTKRWREAVLRAFIDSLGRIHGSRDDLTSGSFPVSFLTKEFLSWQKGSCHERNGRASSTAQGPASSIAAGTARQSRLVSPRAFAQGSSPVWRSVEQDLKHHENYT